MSYVFEVLLSGLETAGCCAFVLMGRSATQPDLWARASGSHVHRQRGGAQERPQAWAPPWSFAGLKGRSHRLPSGGFKDVTGRTPWVLPGYTWTALLIHLFEQPCLRARRGC